MNPQLSPRNKPTAAQRSLTQRVRELLRPRLRRHDPLLVLSLTNFNSGGGWAQVFSPLKVRENVG